MNKEQKEACWKVVNNFCEKYGVTVNNITLYHLTQSSSLAVSMELLGLITDRRMIEYASERGGCHSINKETFEVTSFRDYITSLK